MPYLIDTNVLLRLAAPQDPRHLRARSTVEWLKQESHDLYTAGQNFAEFWSVATRPAAQNGFGKTPDAADQILTYLEEAFPRLPEPAETYRRWRKLIVELRVSGVQVHDARLVAVMLVNEVRNILTFNTRDFVRFAPLGIRATSPNDLHQ